MRCPQCQSRVTPSMRRCLRCGAALPKAAGLTIETLARPAAPYASGDRVVGRYRILEAHGSGPLGTTYRAHDPTGRTMAVKVLPAALFPGDTERREFVERYGQLCGRTLPNASLPVEVGVDNDVIFVASTWVYGASLRSIVRAYRAADRRLERDQVLGVLRGVSDALRALHSMTTHGAVYPENVSVTADAVVLLDPGLAAALPPRRYVERVERAPEVWPYIAPELRVGKRANPGADLFALGALASELLTGDPARSASADFTAPDLGAALESALRAAVSAQASRRVSALPELLAGLAQIAGEASLPPYAPLPSPSEMVDARTRRVVLRGPGAIRPTPPKVPRSPLRERKVG
ncbi:MAG: protein kinase [Myxococcales bacterium]|nr:protein kinase [Myxococcales bacterium]